MPPQYGIAMAAEWARHELTLVAWPTRLELRGDALCEAKREYAALARAISVFEPVLMVAAPGAGAEVHDACGEAVDVLGLPIDDSWMRDSGPLIVTAGDGPRAGVDFGFNGWGEKFLPYDRDAMIREPPARTTRPHGIATPGRELTQHRPLQSARRHPATIPTRASRASSHLPRKTRQTAPARPAHPHSAPEPDRSDPPAPATGARLGRANPRRRRAHNPTNTHSQQPVQDRAPHHTPPHPVQQTVARRRHLSSLGIPGAPELETNILDSAIIRHRNRAAKRLPSGGLRPLVGTFGEHRSTSASKPAGTAGLRSRGRRGRTTLGATARRTVRQARNAFC